MASKSKKRRRVLGASCILAALIVAGSSFAWFTSRDEVTNRLTASSDYGVSIVESFVPPKNMLPGQEVNKDVYAVNTGNIAAFVKETLTGKLNYTYETLVDEFDEACVELGENQRVAIDGVTTNEAGGFLAWTNAVVDTYMIGTDSATKKTISIAEATPKTDADGTENKTFTVQYTADGQVYYAESEDSTDLYIVTGKADTGYKYKTTDKTVAKSRGTYPTGSINSRRQDPNGTDTGTEDDRWFPPATGDYIFRRAIKTTAKDDTTGVTDPTELVDATYIYAGYHYVADEDPTKEGKYYKIVIGEDGFPARDNDDPEDKFVYDIYADQDTVVAAGGTIGEDGVITADDLDINYVVLKKVVDKDVVFTYDEKNLDNEDDLEKFLTAYYSDNQSVQDELNALATEQATAEAQLAAAQTALEQASTTRAQKEVEYEDARGNYYTALSRYTQAKADYEYAKAMAEATNKLIDAANDRAAAEKAKDDAATALQNAATELKTAAGDTSGLLHSDDWIVTMADDANNTASAIGSYTLINQAARDRITAYNTEPTTAGRLANVVSNLGEFDASYVKLKTYADNIRDALVKLAAIENGDPRTETDPATTPTGTNFDNYMKSEKKEGDTEDQVKELYAIISSNRAKMADELNTYSNLFSQIVTETVAENNLTGLNIANATTLSDFITNTFGGFSIADLETKATTYEEAWEAYNDQVKDGGAIAQADSTWSSDVAAYNSAVGTAKTKYDAIVAGDQFDPNMYGGTYLDDDNAQQNLTLTNNGPTLIPYNGTANKAGYSANFTGDDPGTPDDDESTTADNATDDTPKIAATADWKDYTTGTYSNKPIDGSSLKKPATGDGDAAIVKQTIADESVFAQVGAIINDNNKKLGVLSYTDADGNTVTIDFDNLATLADSADSGLRTAANISATDGTLAKDLKDAYITLYGDPTDDNDTGAYGAYEAAKTGYTNAKETFDGLNTTVAQAAARTEAIAENNDSVIKIHVVLDDNWEDNWTMANDGTTAVDFYYNHVLEAGETSEKLVDYVMLCKDVSSKDYKDLVFDLNVALESAQVTYDENQRDYTATAVTENEAFQLKATVKDDNSTVSWAAVAPEAETTYTYTVRGVEVTPTKLEPKVTIGEVEYGYQIVTTYGTFYGTSLDDGTVFKKVKKDAENNMVLATTADGGTLEVTLNATEN